MFSTGKVQTLCSPEEVADWMEEHEWLEMASVESIRPMPLPGEVLTNIPEFVIELSLQVGGGYEAGAQAEMLPLVLRAFHVSEVSLEYCDFLRGYTSQGFELKNLEAPIELEIDVPGFLRLSCDYLEIKKKSLVVVTVPKKIDAFGFRASAEGVLPTPENWVSAFEKLGCNVSWRYFSSEAIRVDQVPENYEGWFLQRPNLIAKEQGGLFFCWARKQGEKITLNVYAHNSEDSRDLVRFAGIVVSRMKDVTIDCGNLNFNSEEWLECLTGDRIDLPE